MTDGADDAANPRSMPTAADSWTDGDAVDEDTFRELWDVLRAHPEYEVRPALQIRSDSSAVVKTVDTLCAAEQTLANFKADVMFATPPFDDLTDEQVDLLSGHDFASDTRDDVPGGDDA